MIASPFPVSEKDMIEFYSKNNSKKQFLQRILNIHYIEVHKFVEELVIVLKKLQYANNYRYAEIYKFIYNIEYYRNIIDSLPFPFEADSIHPYMYKGVEFIATSNHRRYRILASSVEKAFKSNMRTFETYIQTNKWKSFESNYNKLRISPYQVYKQFTSEYCGYYILPELLPDFIEYLTETPDNYIKTIHELLDKNYRRDSIEYRDCAYALLIYQTEDKKNIKLHCDIKYQYEFRNDPQAKNIIAKYEYL